MVGRSHKQVYRMVVWSWLTLSVAGVVMSGVNWLQLFQKLSATGNAEALQETADRILKLFLDAELATLNFAITGSEARSHPTKEAEAALPGRFEQLVNLGRHDPVLLKQVLDLRAESELLLTQLRTVAKGRQEMGFVAAAGAIEAGEQGRSMERLRRRVALLKHLGSDPGSPGGRISREQLMRACLTSLAAGTIGLGAGLYALHLVGMSLRQQQRGRELLEAKLKAESESREKSTLLANMSHEVRTPLNAILGFSELLAGELKQPGHQEYVRSIRASARSLLRLINDILDMSKMEAGVLELHPEPTDPREMCDFIFSVFGETAARKGVKLVCQVAPDLPRAVLLDRVRLGQILVNLVGNAVRFTDRGHIDVRVAGERQEDPSRITLCVEVQDTGVGIPQDRLDAVFTAFVQAGRDQEKEKQGTGLGLAIVKRLTQLMGGTVTVTSIIGQGSAFQLRFPDVPVSVRLPDSGHEDADGRAVDFDALRPGRLLVVDDHEMNCALMRSVFAGSSHRLTFGANGREAVAQARAQHPDVILMDIRMPIMDGLQAVTEIRKTPGLELLPIIAVTSTHLPGDTNGARDQFSGYLRKPFSRRELFDELAHFLPRREKAEPHTQARIAPANGSQRVAGGWRRLAAQLRDLEAQEWPGVRDSLAVSESRAFARRLETLARETGCGPLLEYSETLRHHAEACAVESLEEELQRFPALIARVEQQER